MPGRTARRKKSFRTSGINLKVIWLYLLERKSMFVEQEGDAEMAELFAMGLLKEPKDYGTLTLVSCKHKVFCRTHGTFWIRKKFWKFGNKSRRRSVVSNERKTK